MQGVADLLDVLPEDRIVGEHIADGVDRMEHGSMVALTHEGTDLGEGAGGQFLAEEDRDMARHHDVLGAHLTQQRRFAYIEMFADGLEHLLELGGIGLDTDDTADNLLGELEIDLAVSERSVSEERSQYTLQVADGVRNMGSNEVDYLVREVDTVVVHLIMQDILAELVVRAAYLGGEAPLEARKQAIFDIPQLQRRAVARQDELLARLLEVVEDMEEGVLGALESGEVLDIIDDEHIDRLVEIQKVGNTIQVVRILELQLKRVGSNIKNARMREEQRHLVADGIGQMGLTYSATAVDKQRVEGREAGLLSDSHTGSTCQLVGLSRYERLKGIKRVELRFEILLAVRLRLIAAASLLLEKVFLLRTGRRDIGSRAGGGVDEDAILKLGTAAEYAQDRTR